MDRLDTMADIIPLPLLPWSPPWSIALIGALLVFAVWFLAARAKAVRKYEYDDSWKELRSVLSDKTQQIHPDSLSRLTRRAISEATHVAVDSMSISELESMAGQVMDVQLKKAIVALSNFDRARYLSPESMCDRQAEFTTVLAGIVNERSK